MTKRKTHKEFIEEVKERYGNEYEILSTYINAKTKILVKHNCEKCNFHEWHITPYNLLNNGHGCPICGKEKRIIKQNKNHRGIC